MTYLFGKGAWWIRCWGWLLHCKRTAALFSERNGYEKFYQLPFGGWRIRLEKEKK